MKRPSECINCILFFSFILHSLDALFITTCRYLLTFEKLVETFKMLSPFPLILILIDVKVYQWEKRNQCSYKRSSFVARQSFPEQNALVNNYVHFTGFSPFNADQSWKRPNCLKAYFFLLEKSCPNPDGSYSCKLCISSDHPTPDLGFLSICFADGSWFWVR